MHIGQAESLLITFYIIILYKFLNVVVFGCAVADFQSELVRTRSEVSCLIKWY